MKTADGKRLQREESSDASQKALFKLQASSEALCENRSSEDPLRGPPEPPEASLHRGEQMKTFFLILILYLISSVVFTVLWSRFLHRVMQ